MERELHIIYFTKAGGDLAGRIAADMAENCPDMESVSKVCGKGILQEWTAENFRQGKVLLFIGACGIAVRAIAPHIGGKDTDPAVLVMDEKGRHVIPILSGHLGGANDWACRIARMTGAEAVLTTATDAQSMFAVDLFAKRNGLQIDDLKKAKHFSARLLAERKGTLVLPDEYEQDLTFEGQEPPELEVRSSGEKLREERTPGSDDPEQKSFEKGNVFTVSPAISADDTLHLIPRCIILGMGCRKGKSGQELEQLAESLGVPFETFDAHTLQNAAIENWTFAESERVRETVGVGNVCERAAAAAGAHRILLGKTARDGMTICVGIRPVELSWGTEERPETGGRTLYVIGIGPGSREGMTEEARRALAQSDTIVGYSVYNDLVRPLFPYKRYLTTPMTGEEKRCRMALQEADEGHTVSLICSGDPGVYGMAGLVLEMAEEFPVVEVRVIHKRRLSRYERSRAPWRAADPRLRRDQSQRQADALGQDREETSRSCGSRFMHCSLQSFEQGQERTPAQSGAAPDGDPAALSGVRDRGQDRPRRTGDPCHDTEGIGGSGDRYVLHRLHRKQQYQTGG